MKYLFDANACILLLAGEPGIVRRTSDCFEGDVAISSVAFAEVAWGAWNGKMPPLFVLDQFSLRFPVLPFDLLAAKKYADLPIKRASFDRLIAAHALALDLVLVTSNGWDFADIPGLKVENWVDE